MMILGWIGAGLIALVSDWAFWRSGGSLGSAPITITTTTWSNGSVTTESSGGGGGSFLVLVVNFIIASITVIIKTIIYLAIPKEDGYNIFKGILCAKNYIIFLGSIIVVIVVNISGSTAYNTEYGITKSSDYWYRINETGDGVILDEYTGKKVTEFVFPSEIEELPVVGIHYVFGSNQKFSSFELSKSLTSVIIPETVTRVDYFLSDAINLSQISLPENLKIIGKESFKNSGHTSIVIPEGVTEIGDYAFQNCTKLTSVVFPGNLIKIGAVAFNDCYSLTDVKIPLGTMITYGKFPGITIDAFNGCISLSAASQQALTNSGYTGKFSEAVQKSEIIAEGPTAKVIYEGTRLNRHSSNKNSFTTDELKAGFEPITRINEGEFVVLTGNKSKDDLEVFYNGYTRWVNKRNVIIQSKFKPLNWLKEWWVKL